MKARWEMQCACGCRQIISVGGQFVRYASGPWKPSHLIAYKQQRRQRTVGK